MDGDILYNVFAKVDDNSLVNMLCVCKEWNVALFPEFCKRKKTHDTKTVCRVLNKYGRSKHTDLSAMLAYIRQHMHMLSKRRMNKVKNLVIFQMSLSRFVWFPLWQLRFIENDLQQIVGKEVTDLLLTGLRF